MCCHVSSTEDVQLENYFNTMNYSQINNINGIIQPCWIGSDINSTFRNNGTIYLIIMHHSKCRRNGV